MGAGEAYRNCGGLESADFPMTIFQKTALAALMATMLLIAVGAVVRASGAGLGCPDWPKCWGAMWPPSSLEEVDFEKLDIEKFQRYPVSDD